MQRDDVSVKETGLVTDIELYDNELVERSHDPSDPLSAPGVVLTRTGLTLPASLSFAHWHDIIQTLLAWEQGIGWALGDALSFGEHKYGEKYSQAVEATGRDYGTLMNYVYCAKQVPVSLRSEKLSWSHHLAVAPLVKEQEALVRSLLVKAVELAWSARDIKHAVNWERYKRGKVETLGPADLSVLANTERKFGVIYADPPWEYEHPISTASSIEAKYPTMKLSDICAMRVADIALPGSMLFLWAPAPKTEEAIEVIRAWGYSYRTNMVWDKGSIGMGFYLRQEHELLHIAKRGDIPTPMPADRPGSMIRAKRTEHSEKPLEGYEAAERMYPDIPKVELFARSRREGWSAWGAEVDTRLSEQVEQVEQVEQDEQDESEM